MNEIQQFETQMDAELARLPICHLPIRAVIVTLHVLIDQLAHGHRLRAEGDLPDIERAAALASRISYLAPTLSVCPAEPFRISAQDGQVAFFSADPKGEQLSFLLQYAHLCELMPQYWKGYYSVNGDKSRGFQLSYVSAEFAEFERREFILTELSKAHVFTPFQILDLTDIFNQVAATDDPAEVEQKMFAVISTYYQFYQKAVTEPPLITDVGFQQAAGVNKQEFQRFRAALYAISDFCLGMASAFSRIAQGSSDEAQDRVAEEMMEWISVCWTSDYFFSLIGHFSGIDLSLIEKLVDSYSWIFNKGIGGNKHIRDGFCPPFLRLEGSVIFSPLSVKLFLTWRNLLYGLKEAGKDMFNNLVSCHMEPALVNAAIELLKQVPNLQILANVIWEKGEFDILVFNVAENTALHIQAKAAIPPDGARLVQSLEGRVIEGLEQLERFRSLSPSEKDRILSIKLGYEVLDVKVIDVLLSSSSFGTAKVWSNFGDVVPLNLALLELVLKHLSEQNKVLTLVELPALIEREMERLVEKIEPDWSSGSIILQGTTIKFPLIKHDIKALQNEVKRLRIKHLF